MADESSASAAALLRRSAAFFSQEPDFLGYWLELYRDAEELTPAALARVLQCDVDLLPHLALCLRPRAEQLWEDTAELAERFGIDQDRLCDLLHAAETHAAVRATRSGRAVEQAPGFTGLPAFAAASDREAPEKETGGEKPAVPEGGADGG